MCAPQLRLVANREDNADQLLSGHFTTTLSSLRLGLDLRLPVQEMVGPCTRCALRCAERGRVRCSVGAA